ncbi:NrpR regulatory domain-containing protein [Haladaptatus caseinilyticus]|uniref:NrpR regulatory domain-containing protein n=1 Tax=Haladaptatus caseinilyticus TaxID=2993314 RepID=UPI00224A6FB2|nr:NrpR regulatory domain-containing protein [Haladaptatus caseinilyticus]
MSDRLDNREYDLLRLIEVHGPIGSIRLVEQLQRRGYSIKGRTVRLLLSELDADGYTEKIPGKGRCLTKKGRSELRFGHVGGRLEQVRERIAVLTGQVTYNPFEDSGEIVSSAIDIPSSMVENALNTLNALADLPVAPIPVAIENPPSSAQSDDITRLFFPSSITLDGVLLSQGITTQLQVAGIVEYHPNPDSAPEQFAHEGTLSTEHGGAILRYTDAISGEGSTVDVADLLIEAGRSSIRPLLDGDDAGLVVVDNRELPLIRYEEALDIAAAVRAQLGGVIDFRKPREEGPFPRGQPGWDFASVTFGAVGELAISLLAEEGYSDFWISLHGLKRRSAFEPVASALAAENY